MSTFNSCGTISCEIFTIFPKLNSMTLYDYLRSDYEKNAKCAFEMRNGFGKQFKQLNASITIFMSQCLLSSRTY